ncbi:MAG: hypothetical protein HQM14_10540 [SAR324 cluster bacterium]|nr:hypothetical protein [SAR324 cluster bacterium]
MAQARIFNSKKRRVLRKQIPFVENASSIMLLMGLAGISLWIAVQGDNYNPEDRDVSQEQLLQASSQEKLYNLPLKTWIEPGSFQAAATPNLGLFPEAILDSKWKIESRVKQFDKDNLFEKINGEAEKFLKQGFRSLSYLVLRSMDGGNEIAIELYDQKSMGGSMGIFSDHMSEDKKIEQKNEVVYFETSVGAIGRKGRYFFRVAGNKENETIQQKTRQLITAFSQLEEEKNDTPKEFRILNEKMKISSDRITYQQDNVFQYDFAKHFWFGQFQSDGTARVFLHQETSLEQVKELFQKILEEHSYDYQIIEQGDAQVVMFHEYLKNYFVIGYQGRYLFGIENIKSQEQLAPLMENLAKEVRDG